MKIAFRGFGCSIKPLLHDPTFSFPPPKIHILDMTISKKKHTQTICQKIAIWSIHVFCAWAFKIMMREINI
jgi:hypothetical protein